LTNQILRRIIFSLKIKEGTMPFSAYLESKRTDLKTLVGYLGEKFGYVSVLGTDVKATVYMANKNIHLFLNVYTII
jgi:hypothetical protein